VLSYLLVTNLVILFPVVRETPLRVVFGLPFVLFLPGYTFMAALFGRVKLENEAFEF